MDNNRLYVVHTKIYDADGTALYFSEIVKGLEKAKGTVQNNKEVFINANSWLTKYKHRRDNI